MSGHADDSQPLLQSASRTTTEEPEAYFSIFEVHSDSKPEPDADQLLCAKLALYVSHALSTWGQRMWEFALGLIMLELYPSSLVLVSAFGLADGLAKVFSGSFVGAYIDR